MDSEEPHVPPARRSSFGRGQIFLEESVPGCQEKVLRITAYCNPDRIHIIHGPSCHPVRCHPAGIDHAAANKKGLVAVKYLAENCSAGCTYRAMQWAEENGNSDIVEYLSIGCAEFGARHG
jgi:hypothetical protein